MRDLIIYPGRHPNVDDVYVTYDDTIKAIGRDNETPVKTTQMMFLDDKYLVIFDRIIVFDSRMKHVIVFEYKNIVVTKATLPDGSVRYISGNLLGFWSENIDRR